jgi:hypothetical protein
VPWIRASGLERVIACPAAGHLAQIDSPPGEAAKWGTAVHEWAETGRIPEEYEKLFERRLRALKKAGLSREDFWPEGGRHEVAVALGMVNGVPVVEEFEGTLEERDAWKAAQPEYMAVGTTDYFGDLLGVPVVKDLKTGREVADNPLDTAQQQFYATYLSLKLNAPEVHSAFVHWPRYPADGVPYHVWAPRPWTYMQAVVFLEELEEARRRTLRSRERSRGPDARPGSHCQWCKAAAACPIT